jgi:hypothetical protein
MPRRRQLVTDFKQVTIRELAIDLRRAVDMGLELGIYAYDAYIQVAATRGALLPTDVRKAERKVSSETARTIF